MFEHKHAKILNVNEWISIKSVKWVDFIKTEIHEHII